MALPQHVAHFRHSESVRETPDARFIGRKSCAEDFRDTLQSVVLDSFLCARCMCPIDAGETADFPPAFATAAGSAAAAGGDATASAAAGEADFFGASERLIVFGLPASMANPIAVDRFVADHAGSKCVAEPDWHIDEVRVVVS